MKCNNCGAEISQYESYCSSCGKAFFDDAQQQKEESVFVELNKWDFKLNKNNIVKLLVLTSVVIVSLIAVGNFVLTKRPGESRILSDLPEYNECYPKSVDIELCQKNDDEAEYLCNVTLENDSCKIKAKIELEYQYYETGGWQLEDLSDYYEIDYSINGSFPVSEAEIYLRNQGYSVSFVDEDIDLENGICNYYFSYEKQNVLYDETGKYTLKYVFDSYSGWVLREKKAYGETFKLKLSEVVWAGSDRYFEIIKCTENQITYADYDITDERYSVEYYTDTPIWKLEDGCAKLQFGNGNYIIEEEKIVEVHRVYSGEERVGMKTISPRDFSRYTCTNSQYYTDEIVSRKELISPPNVVGCKLSEAIKKVETAGFEFIGLKHRWGYAFVDSEGERIKGLIEDNEIEITGMGLSRDGKYVKGTKMFLWIG